jgi:glucosamine 6-phosphate synthetase-like amidotransferase/phosphosugar isomerase protein
MCSISGCIIFQNKNPEIINNKIKLIIERATDRGRDSYGIVSFDRLNRSIKNRVYKKVATFNSKSIKDKIVKKILFL